MQAVTSRLRERRPARRVMMKRFATRKSPMKRIALSLVLTFAFTGASLAQGRPSTLSRSCAANQQSVRANGAIVLGTGGYTYDRFVAHRGFCQFDEYADPAWVPARDTPQCFIGYRCKSGPFWDD